MSSIKSEYHRFLISLAQRGVSDEIRRFANVVWVHLDDLAQFGAVRRARSNRLAPLAIQELSETSPDTPPFEGAGGDAQQLHRLQSLTVGPFRGFSNPEEFDLSQMITLVYGANGTGKSSFCEALETSMLGSITEARAKRVDLGLYCNNARIGRHDPPMLMVSNEAGVRSRLQPSEERYRFCFIEKNRLDDFARIAARTPGDQRQLIATLFGVEQFNDFVRGFNPSLDDNLNLQGLKAAELANKRSQLALAEQTIEGHEAKLAGYAAQDQAAAEVIQPNTPFSHVLAWVRGAEQRPGRLQYLVSALDGPTPTVYNILRSNLEVMLANAYTAQEAVNTSAAELANRAGDVSYRQLYEAVISLTEVAGDACPACGTSLDRVAQNPYENARIGLAQLQELANLQALDQENRTRVDTALSELLDGMRRSVEAISAVVDQGDIRFSLPELPARSEGPWLQPWIENNRQPWNELLRLVAFVEQHDERARQTLEQRQVLSDERSRLEQFNVAVERTNALRLEAQGQFEQARNTVSQFEQVNRTLIEEVRSEVPVVQYHQRVKVAYDGFLDELKRYLASLPRLLLQGLGDHARDLYNAFNRDDPQNDLLNALWLPIAENGKIELEFVGEPGVRYDALVILSEGHIKCLGLAILLAKNLQQECPVVIFDDVVNAIDDEHRNGIWRTFFEDGHLDAKQVVLTSHAEEFLHRIQQELGADRAALIKRYKFLPHLGDHELRVDGDPPTKNYVALAQAAVEADEKRDALRYARPAIESLTDRVWTWMSRRGYPPIELKLPNPKSPWELNNKASKIRSKLNSGQIQNEAIASFVSALDVLLGINNQSMEWRYLNSGTHDSQRDGEFDRAIVAQVVEATADMDQALTQLQNR